MTDIPHADLLADIRAFCAARNLPVTKFGELAMGDTRFVSDLEKGRQCLPKTVAKAQGYMMRERATDVHRGAA